MKETNILNRIERDMFRVSIRDGIIDLQIGIILLNFAIVPFLSVYLGDFWSSATFLIVWPAAIYGLRAYRKRYVLPRTGKIEYGAHRKRKLTNLNILMVIFNVIALILGVISFTQFSFLPGWVYTFRLSILLLIGFSLPGYMLDYPRLYAYGLMVATAPILGELLFSANLVRHHGFPLAFGFSGTVIIILGLIDLLRIFRNYPREELEENAE